MQKSNSLILLVKHSLAQDANFLIFLLLGTFLVYATSFGNEFLSDDIWGIRDSQVIGLFWEQAKYLNVKSVTFSLIYNVFGPKPFWFHLHNTFVHLINISLVYVLVYLINPNKLISRLTTLLFALHPIATESVTWISGTPYAVITTLILVSYGMFILVVKNRIHFWWTIPSALLYFFALRTTLFAITTPALFFLYLLYFSQLSMQKMKLLIPVVVTTLLLGTTLLFQFSGRVSDVNPDYAGGIEYYNPFQQIPAAIGTYVQLFTLPYNLTLYHEFNMYPQWLYIVSSILTISLLLAIILFWRFNKLCSFGLLFFLVSLIPSLLPIRVAWIVAERYAYLGSIGFFLALASVSTVIIVKHGWERYMTTVLLILAVVLGGLTVKRNLEWRSQDTLWPVTVKRSPDSAYAHNNMGDYYGRHGDYQKAIQSFENARKLRPRYAEATHNLANMYLSIGEATKAATLYKEAAEYNPTQHQSYHQLGSIAFELGKYDEAVTYFEKAAEVSPNPFQQYVAMFITYQTIGDRENAARSMEQAQLQAKSNPELLRILQQLQLQYPQN